MQNTCYSCKGLINEFYNFCPQCGANLKNNGSPTVGSQISIFALSFFLPPLGLIPSIKLMRRPNSTAKTTGVIGIILTVVSIALGIGSYMAFMNYYSSTLLNLNQKIPGM